ncbi:MAG: aspartyl protease family protein [bacterium]
MKILKAALYIFLVTAIAVSVSLKPAYADTIKIEYTDWLGLILFEGDINGETGWFLLDTGADSSIVDIRFAERIGLKKLKSPLSILGMGGIDEYAAKNVGIGEWYFEDVPIVGFDLSIVDRYLGFNLAAILGADFLRKYALTIDYQESYFTLSDESPDPGLNAHIIPFRISDKLVFLKASPMNSDKEYTFLVDTGATSVVYFQNRLEEVYPEYKSWPRSLGWQEATFMGKKDADIFLMPEFSIGDAGIESLVTTVTQPGLLGIGLNLIGGSPVHGVVGWTFLRYWKVTFDYPNKRLILEPYEFYKEKWPHMFDSVGFMIAYENGKPTIDHILPDTPAADADLQIGDVLLAIDGKDALKMDLLEISEMVMGEPGTDVVFLFERDRKQFRLTLKRVHLFTE